MPKRTKSLQRQAAHRHGVLFVLAMLCLRAFVPAGYMLAPQEGQLRVVLCDSDALIAPHSLDHAHHGADHQNHHHTHVDPTCPYAQSAGPAPLPSTPPPLAVLVTVAPALPTSTAQTLAHFGPFRQQSPRAPPQLG